MKKLITILLLLINLCGYSQIVTKDTSTKETIIGFIKWYIQNRRSLIDKPGRIKMQEGRPYRVNFYQTNKYCNNLSKSNMLSKLYIKELKKYFIRCDKNFEKFPQTFGVPNGFDYDLVMKSNDYDNIENNVDNSVIAFYKRKGNNVYMKLDFIIKNSASNRIESYNFQLSKHKGKWLIDKINGDFPEEIDHHEISWPK